MELVAESSGTLTILVQEGETVPIGTVIGTLLEGEKQSEGPPPSLPDQQPPTTPSPEISTQTSYAQGHPSPAAQKVLGERQMAPDSVQGTGKDGRITKDDALKASSAAPVQEHGHGSEGVERKKMSSLRKTIAARLVEAKNTTAMLTTFNEVDMSKTIQLRKKYQDEFVKKYDVKLGFMSLFTKALTEAVKHFPDVNASIEDDDILYHRRVHVGVAVSTPKGLVVPVVRNAESLGLAEIEKEIILLAEKARNGKLSVDEMRGGTITITNGGIFGSMLSTPLLNIPQSAILGMHNIVERPVAVNGQVEIRPIMYVALSYDHRIIDGKQSVGFFKTGQGVH